MRRVLANLCVYIAEHGKGQLKNPNKHRKRRKRKPRRAAQFSKPLVPIWVLGHGVKLGRDLIDAAKSDTGAGARENRWKLSKRFCVRGHFRRQACGVGRRDRKLIWIEPHWKGPRTGTRLAHLYTDTPTDEK